MENLSNLEKEFIKKTGSESGLRIDGRRLDQMRRIGILFHESSVEVSLGDTLIFAAIESSICAPYDDRPHEGFLNFNVEFLPMAHPKYENVIGSRPHHKHKRIRNDISIEIERMLEKTIKKSKAINVESLSIVSGKHVWNLTVNLHILSHFGNLIDTSELASVVALMHMKLPTLNSELKPTGTYKNLNLHFLPISVTVGIIENFYLVDPHLKEETMLDGKVIVCMNIFGDVLAIKKTGIAPLDRFGIDGIIAIASEKVRDVTRLIREEVNKNRNLPSSFSQDNFNQESALKLISSL